MMIDRRKSRRARELFRAIPGIGEINVTAAVGGGIPGAIYLGVNASLMSWQLEDNLPRAESTRIVKLTVAFVGGTTDVLSLMIRKGFRRQGLGRQMVQCTETLAREWDFRFMQVTPSGEGIHFWPKMGFTPDVMIPMNYVKQLEIKL